MSERENNITMEGMRMDLDSYETIIVAFSGGKDSLACVLHLLDSGVPKNKIELWHHDVDGKTANFMDWACTDDYCRKVAEALGVKIYYSWKVGGFKREMLRENSLTAPTTFETPDGLKTVGGTQGKPSTRMKFPQVSPNLSVRWCSAYLKIDICATAIRNQERFNNSRTLVVTGERAEESASRAKYKTFEPDRADNREGRKLRHVDRWRPVHSWDEQKVWDILKKYKVNPHPAYHLGWGRVSCASCIFGNKDQWASLNEINPDMVQAIADYESQFRLTINRTKSVPELVDSGTPYPALRHSVARIANSSEYTEIVILNNWELPAGAFGDSCGPS